MKHTKQSIISKDGVSYLIPFILITSCFALWGFANDITNPMVKAFSKIFRMSATDGALVQVALYTFYGNGRDSYKTSEPRPVFQSNGIAARNVRGDAIYSG